MARMRSALAFAFIKLVSCLMASSVYGDYPHLGQISRGHYSEQLQKMQELKGSVFRRDSVSLAASSVAPSPQPVFKSFCEFIYFKFVVKCNPKNDVDDNDAGVRKSKSIFSYILWRRSDRQHRQHGRIDVGNSRCSSSSSRWRLNEGDR